MTVLARLFSLAVTLLIALPVFADSAPVFDADTMQQQFEQAGQPVPDSVPPPAETKGQASTFMPVSQDSARSTPAAQPQVVPSTTAATTSAMTPDQRLRHLEQQVNTLQSSDLGPRTDSLQTEVQSLRSQVEQLTHQLAQVQTQQKAMVSAAEPTVETPPQPSSSSQKALDSEGVSKVAPTPVKTSLKTSAKTTVLAKATPKAAAVLSTAAAKPASTQDTHALDVAEEQKIYQTAYDLIKAKKYSEAATTLQGMLKKYPSGQFASNAHYWLGELYGLMGKNDQALTEFSTVVKVFPTSPRVSDAELKVGLIFASQNQWPDAKSALKKVTVKYPGTASARLAMEQLTQIKQAGH